MPIRRLAVVLVAALTVVGGCAASPDTTGPLPDGRELVDTATRALADVRGVRFEFHVSGALPGLPVRTVEGVATRDGGPHGSARGEADVQRGTERHRYDFVLDGAELRLTDPDDSTADRDGGAGGTRPAPGPLTPARLLDPEHGLTTLLREATALETESREELDGVPSYRVGGELDREVVAGFVPGVHDDVAVKFWVAGRGQGQLLRVWMQVPPRQKNEGAVMLELALDGHETAATGS
ncbi:LppX_LprAFG lipoprotein [Saccharomonospora iraqiensis]|uniref:LppX_LprAFG lipoprotein n=1 Tax=Saccharomonospora iraqiensis TaxID=52698 RepID=UPI0002E35A25|nr:LppX_LprAFG lipoprotein [Saccharomonospora iraqiensis]